jgi:hypothetical protein
MNEKEANQHHKMQSWALEILRASLWSMRLQNL